MLAVKDVPERCIPVIMIIMLDWGMVFLPGLLAGAFRLD
jgi:hypothetical protein